jgi:hypothetical protein
VVKPKVSEPGKTQPIKIETKPVPANSEPMKPAVPNAEPSNGPVI